ncbi:MAG: glycoside hydrolase family 2, partial [Gemmatimonadetes bacterium]|nr:glycoside hydrolase family 2 [Gemmatimonadota bacterium]
MDTSLDAPQRRRIVVILVTTLVILGGVVADLATGGRPDPPPLRAAATLLDGVWRFRTGDDPHWADVATDDHDWETIDLTASPGSHDGDVGLPDYVGGWMAHGHPDYRGYAWYRRAVTVPATDPSWDILGPTLVDEGYELYWNGQLLGRSGRIDADPRVVGTRPMRFALPDSAAGTRGVLAVRVFMRPSSGASADGGGMHSAPILAPRPVAAGLHRAQWARTVAGYIADAVEPMAMFALIALALLSASRTTYRPWIAWACVALAFMASRRLNNAITAWSDLQSLTTYAWLATWMWVPAV